MDSDTTPKPEPTPNPEFKPVDDATLVKAAKEFAASFPSHIKRLIPRPDLDAVKLTSSAAAMDILYAAYMMAAQDGSPSQIHEWFIDSLKDFFKRVEEGYRKMGIYAHFEIMVRDLRQGPPSDTGHDFGGGEEDWSKGRRW